MRKDANVAVIPSVARPTGGAWYEGTDLRAVGKACGIIEACFYEPSPMRVKADLFDIRRRVDPQTKIRGLLRPAFPDLASRGDLVAAVAASRVYLGLHYPLDVTAAAVYAVCAFAFLSALVMTRPARRLLAVVHLDPCAPDAPSSDQPSVPPEGDHA